MLNFIQSGRTITIPAPSDIESGNFVIVGLIRGVAQGDAAAGDPMDLLREGVFSLPAAAAASFAVGDAAYWSEADKQVTATSTDTLIGTITEAAPAGAGEVSVLLT